MENKSASRHAFSDFSSFSRLFSSYTQDFESLATYFAGDFRDPRQRGQIARQVAEHFSGRKELVAILHEQNTRFGTGDATRTNIDRLGSDDAVAIVTGQQLGLFGGPLYTILKTITTIQLARRLEKDTGRSVVPVFWLEGEDHDFEEVSTAWVFSGQRVGSVAYTDGDHRDSKNPVGRILFDDRIQATINQLTDLLPPTDFRPELLRLLESCYRPGTSFLDSFARLMCTLFSDQGLVFISGDDPRFKQKASGLFRKEILEFKKPEALLNETSRKLKEGFHAQVASTPPNLFLLTDEGRFAVVATRSGFELKGTGQSYSSDELIALLDAEPERFSPNVVLRPLYQDTLLPTAAYVGGPGEISYFAQFRQIYEWAGIPMPIIYPRASVTLVEKKIAKVLTQIEAPLPSFSKPVDALFHELVVEGMKFDPDALFDGASRHIGLAIDEVLPTVEEIDRSLKKSAESTRALLLKEWGRLKDRVIKAEKRRSEQMKGQLEKVAINVFPNGTLQERVISPLYFLNKYGPGLISTLLDNIDLDTSRHQEIHL